MGQQAPVRDIIILLEWRVLPSADSYIIAYFWFCRGKDASSSADIPLPARRERLRENQDVNKENSILDSINEEHVEALVEKGYNRLKVVEALRVAKNNIAMAEEILETFVKQT